MHPCQIVVKEQLEGFAGMLHEVEHNVKHPGMSLRDHFAALAMQGLIIQGIRPLDEVVRQAYEYASAMVAANIAKITQEEDV